MAHVGAFGRRWARGGARGDWQTFAKVPPALQRLRWPGGIAAHSPRTKGCAMSSFDLVSYARECRLRVRNLHDGSGAAGLHAEQAEVSARSRIRSGDRLPIRLRTRRTAGPGRVLQVQPRPSGVPRANREDRRRASPSGRQVGSGRLGRRHPGAVAALRRQVDRLKTWPLLRSGKSWHREAVAARFNAGASGRVLGRTDSSWAVSDLLPRNRGSRSASTSTARQGRYGFDFVGHPGRRLRRLSDRREHRADSPVVRHGVQIQAGRADVAVAGSVAHLGQAPAAAEPVGNAAVPACVGREVARASCRRTSRRLARTENPWDRTTGLLRKVGFTLSSLPRTGRATLMAIQRYEPRTWRLMKSAPLAGLVGRFTGCSIPRFRRQVRRVCVILTTVKQNAVSLPQSSANRHVCHDHGRSP